MARQHILKFRVDDAELATVEAAAKACNQSVSDFLRGVVLGSSEPSKHVSEAPKALAMPHSGMCPRCTRIGVPTCEACKAKAARKAAPPSWSE